MSVPAEYALNQLKWAVQALACDAAVQLKLFPDFTHKPDELALDYDNWYQATKWREDIGLNSARLEKMKAMDSHIKSMSPERFREKLLISGEDWEKLRRLARSCLSEWNWPFEVPPTGRSYYVEG